MSSTTVAPMAIPASDPVARLSVATADITNIRLKVAMNSITNDVVVVFDGYVPT